MAARLPSSPMLPTTGMETSSSMNLAQSFTWEIGGQEQLVRLRRPSNREAQLAMKKYETDDAHRYYQALSEQQLVKVVLNLKPTDRGLQQRTDSLMEGVTQS